MENRPEDHVDVAVAVDVTERYTIEGGVAAREIILREILVDDLRGRAIERGRAALAEEEPAGIVSVGNDEIEKAVAVQIAKLDLLRVVCGSDITGGSVVERRDGITRVQEQPVHAVIALDEIEIAVVVDIAQSERVGVPDVRAEWDTDHPVEGARRAVVQVELVRTIVLGGIADDEIDITVAVDVSGGDRIRRMVVRGYLDTIELPVDTVQAVGLVEVGCEDVQPAVPVEVGEIEGRGLLIVVGERDDRRARERIR